MGKLLVTPHYACFKATVFALETKLVLDLRQTALAPATAAPPQTLVLTVADEQYSFRPADHDVTPLHALLAGNQQNGDQWACPQRVACFRFGESRSGWRVQCYNCSVRFLFQPASRASLVVIVRCCSNLGESQSLQLKMSTGDELQKGERPPSAGVCF